MWNWWVVVAAVILFVMVQLARAFNLWVEAHKRDSELTPKKKQADEIPGGYERDLRSHFNNSL